MNEKIISDLISDSDDVADELPDGVVKTGNWSDDFRHRMNLGPELLELTRLQQIVQKLKAKMTKKFQLIHSKIKYYYKLGIYKSINVRLNYFIKIHAVGKNCGVETPHSQKN